MSFGSPIIWWTLNCINQYVQMGIGARDEPRIFDVKTYQVVCSFLGPI